MKVLPFSIPKSPHENLIYQVDEADRFYDKLHQHEEIQISFIGAGSGKLVLMDGIYPFGPNDLFVLGGNIPHLFKSEDELKHGSKMYSLFFTKDSFGEQFFNLLELGPLQPFFKKALMGFKITNRVDKLGLHIKQMETRNRLERFTDLLTLLQDLANAPSVKLLPKVPLKLKSAEEGERLQRIFDLVIQNFNRPIQLKEVAETCFMTQNSFCRFFKKHTNKSFFDFLISYRIEHACLELANSKGRSIMEIAEACGFRSQSNFNRRFKEIKGTTPTAFRAALR